MQFRVLIVLNNFNNLESGQQSNKAKQDFKARPHTGSSHTCEAIEVKAQSKVKVHRAASKVEVSREGKTKGTSKKSGVQYRESKRVQVNSPKHNPKSEVEASGVKHR